MAGDARSHRLRRRERDHLAHRRRRADGRRHQAHRGPDHHHVDGDPVAEQREVEDRRCRGRSARGRAPPQRRGPGRAPSRTNDGDQLEEMEADLPVASSRWP